MSARENSLFFLGVKLISFDGAFTITGPFFKKVLSAKSGASLISICFVKEAETGNVKSLNWAAMVPF